MKLKHCAVISVVTFMLVMTKSIVMWMPYVALYQNLGFGPEALPQVHAPAWWPAALAPVSGVSFVALSLASLAFTLVGWRRETAAKRGWKVLLVLGVLTLIVACGAAIAAPKVAMLYRDYGIK